MKDVRISKTELQTAVAENREKHREHFERALSAWKNPVIEALGRAHQDALDGKRFQWRFNLPQPEDHTDDYDDIIGMLEMSLDDSITLTRQEYRQYINDDWD